MRAISRWGGVRVFCLGAVAVALFVAGGAGPVRADGTSKKSQGAKSSQTAKGAGGSKAPAAPKAPMPVRDKALNDMMASIAKELTVKHSRSHKLDKVYATVIDLGPANDPFAPRIGSWRGEETVYPASVVKIYYMAAAFAWAQAGRLNLTSQVMKDLELMIGPSSNTATQRTLNRLCGVQPGEALTKAEFEDFKRKRNQVNEWLQAMGITSTNANAGTWDGRPSPRDLQLMTLRLDGQGPRINHNSSTTEDVARFLLLIATDKIGGPGACGAMREIMSRSTSENRNRQGIRKIFQDSVPEGSKVWGKSGYTSQTSHDAAIIVSPKGRRFILVVFAETYYERTSFLGDFASETMRRLEKLESPAKGAEKAALVTGVPPSKEDDAEGESG